jgi:hypothetical protein
VETGSTVFSSDVQDVSINPNVSIVFVANPSPLRYAVASNTNDNKQENQKAYHLDQTRNSL